MLYRGFKSSVVVRNSETGTYYGTVENAADYLKFESDSFTQIEAAFQVVVDNYIKECESIGKDPFMKGKSLGHKS